MEPSPKTREELDEDVRNLVYDLHVVQTTLKLGSIEREQREDEIFRRLYYISEIIKTDYATDKRMNQLYTLIRQENIPLTPAISTTDIFPPYTTKPLPVYTDAYNMFTRTTLTPKTIFFIEQMATDLKVGSPDQIRNHLSHHDKDGGKEILQSTWSNVDREEWLRLGASNTCSNCWNSVMHRVFLMMAEVVAVEMRNRAYQVIDMTKKGQLTMEDAKDLAQHISHVIKKIDRLLTLATSEKSKKKDHMVNLVEALFRLMINVVNEIMIRYVKLLHVKNSFKNVQIMENLSM